ncbi:uncharacterized protein LOC106659996 [Trichogramma pretiosum]|uniref:uncharacterized protein LOC106659996 n=1 Tax=Trichogramma pretiosum TaxID=7493 RepID=UPI0006C9AAF1|nr:uncharacterized protein LOC106659996 [Trichogramma pretiosum]
MFKLAVFLALVGCALAAPKPGLLLAEPVVHAAPVIASAPVATSYQNTVKISKDSGAKTVVTHHLAAPAAVVPVATVHHAAPVITHHAVAPAVATITHHGNVHLSHAVPTLAVAHY